jgi:hypothetical protein
MSKPLLNYILLFIVLVLSQAVIFNNLALFGCAMPFVFIYLIISLPVTLSTNWSLTAGFVVGLLVDIFSNTYGINAMACTFLSFVRKPVFHLYVSRDEDLAGQRPTMRTMGSGTYMKYALTMILLYCIFALTIEAFTFFNFLRLLLRIVTSTLYTFIIIYAIDSLSVSRREKKL